MPINISNKFLGTTKNMKKKKEVIYVQGWEISSYLLTVSH